jgi:hypothetical protein
MVIGGVVADQLRSHGVKAVFGYNGKDVVHDNLQLVIDKLVNLKVLTRVKVSVERACEAIVCNSKQKNGWVGVR